MIFRENKAWGWESKASLVVILQGPVAASCAGRDSLGSVLGLQSKAHMKRAFGWDDLAWGVQQGGP